MRALELLAPAKNLAVGKAAIDCGADAVYIGAEAFGARAAAGNSIEDIAELVKNAHQFGAKVFVTINNLIHAHVRARVRNIIDNVRARGVDAILVQDLSILDLCQNIEIHASTQSDNRSAERVKELSELGFARVVLARELGVDEIRQIHEANPTTELEVFVHGALCVSYSGACYASEHCFGRSANRGECAQMCRLKYDLVDSEGQTIESSKHLLSLKDLALIDHLEELADAGAVSFKIEGRLKEADYVRNVVAAYNQRLNALVARRPNDYCRASRGVVTYNFTPDIHKTFNRGYTTYFLNGRQEGIANFVTPKSLGEQIQPGTKLNNGDGLCFINDAGELEGFRVNNAEHIKWPASYRKGMPLFRNHNEAFAKLLNNPNCATRRIPITLEYGLTDAGYYLATEGKRAQIEYPHEEARNSQRDNIIKQLSRFGNTIYEVQNLIINDNADSYFVPSSVLSSLRQALIETLSAPALNEPALDAPTSSLLNTEYRKSCVGPNSEFKREVRLMQCRYCLRHALGYCPKHHGLKSPWHEPLYLKLSNGITFQLEFDCKTCQMNLLPFNS